MPSLPESPKFQFIHSDGTPKAPTGSVRSHAIRAGLQQRLKNASIQAGECAAAAPPKPKLKDGLGRFRLANAPPNPRKGRLGKRRSKRDDADPREETAEGSSGVETAGSTTPEPFYADEGGGRSRSLRGLVLARRASGELPVERHGGEVLDPFGTFPVPYSRRIDLILKQSTCRTGPPFAAI